MKGSEEHLVPGFGDGFLQNTRIEVVARDLELV